MTVSPAVPPRPSGAACNLDCAYCFFLDKEALYSGSKFPYAAPFRFSGMIKHIVIDMSGEPIEDDDARVRLLMAQQ